MPLRYMKNLLVQIIASLVLLVPLIAQETAQPQRTLSMVIIDDGVNTVNYVGDSDAGIPETPYVPLYFLSNDTPRQVNAPFTNLSPFFHYRGPDTLTFYLSPPSPDPQAPKPPVAGTVTLPHGMTDIILLLVTENFADRRFRIIPIDESSSTFPENSIRLFNLSSLDVAFEIGGQRDSVAANTMKSVQVQSDEPFKRIRIGRFDQAANQWRLAYNRYTRILDGHRSTYLILNRPFGHSNQLFVQRIHDPVQLRTTNLRQTGGEPEEVDPPL